MRIKPRVIALFTGAAALLGLLVDRALALLSSSRATPPARATEGLGREAQARPPGTGALATRGTLTTCAPRIVARLGLRSLPRAFAASEYFYAASGASLSRYTPEGALLEELSLPAPVEALLVSGGRLYAAAREAVYVFDESSLGASGEISRPLFDLGPGARIVSLARDGATGELYAACAARALVYRYSADGRLLALIGAAGGAGGAPGLIAPSPYLAVSVAPDGMVIVANPGRHGVELYEPGGRLVSSFYKEPGSPDGFAGCCNPVGVLAMGDDIITVEKGAGRVRRYGRDGTLVEELKGAEAELGLFASLAAASGKALYLLDPEEKAVTSFGVGS